MSAKELEVGMYVRTNEGIGTIHKIVTYQDGKQDIYLVKFNKGHIKKWINVLKEPSHNIIDLIEVGDYVNGILVSDITGEYLRIDGESHNKYYFSKEIKSILTHEQFEREAYKV